MTATILVVDDNVDSAITMAELLKMRGYSVHVCHRGDDAIAYYNEHRADIIVALLDLGLPAVGGLEVASHIRRDPDYYPILIAVTGWGNTADREATTAVGFNAHFVKPADPKEIFSIISMMN